jgi:hypothetical protein
MINFTLKVLRKGAVMKLHKKTTYPLLGLLVSLVLAACSMGTSKATPTMSIEALQTIAIGTYAAGLTQTAFAMPTNTPTSTPTETPTSTPTIKTSVPTTPIIPTSSCYGLTGVKDVTIPDKTAMAPGQTFTKTWLVRNTGTCNWEAGFKLVFFKGDAMGGSTLVLDKTYAPGAEVELSINMTAPTNKTGELRGDWQMSTASGLFFGEEQYIIITIGASTPTATGTPPTATPSLTPTFTNTP